MKQKNNALIGVLLGLIVLAAGILRIYKVNVNPPSLSWDEVSIGYNAYSILKTGRDEHGKLLPLDTFIAYGDYKPPLSIYATVPAVALFGLNEFSVRLPSAIAGTLTVLLTFFLGLELFGILSLALFSSVILAVSPWHVQLSRAGFEANIALFFIVLGVILVLKTRHHVRMWLIALLPFVAAIYTFNSARYFSPLFGLGLLWYVRPFGYKTVKWLIAGFIVAIVALAPILPHIVSPQARLRFTEVNIFSDPGIVLTANDRMDQDNQSLVGRIVHNRRIGYARSYLIHFFDHFDPQFLFVRGDGNPKFSIQDVGQLYLIEFPFLIAGFFWIVSRSKSIGFVLLYWIIAAIIPAAVARETPHALRIENSLPVWQISIAAGIVWCIGLMNSKTGKKLLGGFIFLLYLFMVSYYLHNYYTHYPTEYSGEWQYGYREAIRAVEPYKNEYKKIYMTESIGRPYMYVLFYDNVDPSYYLETKKSYFDAEGFYHVTGYGKYSFVGNTLPQLQKGSLYILPSGSAPKGARILQTIYKLNGDPVLEIFDI